MLTVAQLPSLGVSASCQGMKFNNDVLYILYKRINNNNVVYNIIVVIIII